MSEEEILTKIKANQISIEQAFQELNNIGYCPALVNDDEGRWAVSFEGYQEVVLSDVPQDLHTSFFIEAKQWDSDIRKALIIALSNN